MKQITGSIVLYRNNEAILKKAIDSFLNTSLDVKLYLIDNSPTDALRTVCLDKRCEYIFNNKNLGFGKAHNLAIKRSLEESPYHVVLNPDIYFEEGTLRGILAYMEQHPEVGQVMPKILYPDNSIQYLCKLLPTPFDLIFRRFLPFLPGTEQRNNRYELRGSHYDKIMNIPYLSGCFMFFRNEALRKVGFFDERIFMYIEDADLTRRIHRHYKTLFYPTTIAYHHYAKGSYKSLKLMLYNIHGAAVYFFKYGWFFDRERREINERVIQNYLKPEGK